MSDSYERHFRFYDNREKYLLFVSTCSEKQVIAERVALDIRVSNPCHRLCGYLTQVWVMGPFSRVS